MKIAIGTAQFGINYGISNTEGKVKFLEVSEILRSAFSQGIKTLDTAIAYGDSENVLGQYGVHEWETITKLPALPDDCQDVAQWVQDQIQQSMARLRITHLHGVLLHCPDQLHSAVGPALYKALQDIKIQGITKKIGVSIYSPAELDTLLDAYDFDLIQSPLNILDRRLLESGWASRLHAAGIEVHTRSAFLQGLLLMPAKQRPSKFNRWDCIWNTWEQWLTRENLTPLQACLRFYSNLPEIDRVIVGVDTADQLNEIIESAKGELRTLPTLYD